jgi:hypothetical protein
MYDGSNMADENQELIHFLEERATEIRKLSGLAFEITNLKRVDDLGGSYADLILKVKEAFKRIDISDKQVGKQIKADPSLRSDPRIAWHKLVRTALHKASTHGRPPVDSRNLDGVQTAAGVIDADLSFCIHSLETKLNELRR